MGCRSSKKTPDLWQDSQICIHSSNMASCDQTGRTDKRSKHYSCVRVYASREGVFYEATHVVIQFDFNMKLDNEMILWNNCRNSFFTLTFHILILFTYETRVNSIRYFSVSNFLSLPVVQKLGRRSHLTLKYLTFSSLFLTTLHVGHIFIPQRIADVTF